MYLPLESKSVSKQKFIKEKNSILNNDNKNMEEITDIEI
jgi:hypothetical protein